MSSERNMEDVFESIRYGLMVSCQADIGDPFNTVDSIIKFALAADMGGAKALRLEGIENILGVMGEVDLPICGIVKSKYPDGSVRISRSISEFQELYEAGCNIIAVDGTSRMAEGWTGPEFIKEMKSKYNTPILADIATIEDAYLCRDAGADAIATTLNGYTEDTLSDNNGRPNMRLVEDLLREIDLPVIAEGRVSLPEEARDLLRMGAFCVVVGTPITRPQVVTAKFVKVIRDQN
jgi:N-acylglucosamine-6-phosphate 2-epimerase